MNTIDLFRNSVSWDQTLYNLKQAKLMFSEGVTISNYDLEGYKNLIQPLNKKMFRKQ